MISSVTVTKFGTVRIVAVGVCASPIELKAHSRAALIRDFLIKYLIAPSLGIFGPARLVRRVWVAFFAIDEKAARDPWHRSCLIAKSGTMGTRPCRHVDAPAHTATNSRIAEDSCRGRLPVRRTLLRVPTHRKR